MEPPFLTSQSFDAACQQLEAAYRKHQPQSLRIELRMHDGEHYLRIKRTLIITQDVTDRHEDVPQSCGEEDVDAEADEAAISPIERPCHRHVLIEYDIILSRTYQVPVLYFMPSQVPPSIALGLDFVYEYLVPSSSKAELKQTSVMGGITVANHPINNVPWFFIHPCNTPNAMREIIGARSISGLEYLQIWIGLIGSHVGLYLPKELAIKHIGNN